MATRTRDKVWDAAFLLIGLRSQQVTAAEVADLSGVSDRTTREVLSVMDSNSWVCSEWDSKGRRVYAPGARMRNMAKVLG